MLFRDVYDKIQTDEVIMRIGALRERYDFYGVEDTAEISDYVVSPDDFFFLTSFVSAQKKASSIDNFIARVIGGEVIPASFERGDVEILEDGLFTQGDYIELKTSTSGNIINANQIRPWQDIDYYLLSYIDELHLGNSVSYLLTHDEMTAACEMFGSATHGTRNVSNVNQLIEYSIKIPVYNYNSAITQWFDDYRDDTIRDYIIGYEV